MRIGIFSNEHKDSGNENAYRLSEIIRSKGVETFLFNNTDRPYLKSIIKETEIELLIVFGGDGTILGIVSAAAYNDIPILGVNLGRVGFLTEVEEKDDWEELIERYGRGEYNIDERTLLEVKENSQSYLALNEALICRNEECCVTTIDVYIDNIFMDRYIGDGVLISTPTGSTAYSLSAGGPILSPDISAMLINPVCPHSLHNRPIVISDRHMLELKLMTDRINAKVVVDGKLIAIIDNEDKISIKKSHIKAKFLRFNDSNFYNRLLIKMNYWSNIRDVKE